MSNIFDKFSLEGRSAVVTGAAGLLGKEFCRTLCQAGARVVAADINGKAVTDLADSLIQESWIARGVRADVTDPASVQQMVASAVDVYQRLDIMVNCAALDPKFDANHSGEHLNTFEDYPLDAWNQALSVNLTGMFLSCQAAVKPMLTQDKGVIINICSTYGLVGPDQRIYQKEGLPPRYKPVYYSVTKSGVLGLTRYLAAYYAGRNIRVNALTPGGVYNQHDPEFVHEYSARTILGRMAEKDEMNGALLFLASDASTYMTGANLVVDGGWTAW